LAAGGHYNVQIQANISPAEISPDTEVWLDFQVNKKGEAQSSTTVPFVPTTGERSIVIHRDPTMDSGAQVGTAGPRIACLPFTIR
jgi:Cu-Zn family superoxide dismutase